MKPQDAAHLFDRARRRRDAAEELLAAGAKPTTPVGRFLAHAERQMARANEVLRPGIQADQRRGYRRER